MTEERPTFDRFAPGDKLDRYELLCPIAEGGMACVWAARLRGRHGFEKLVAIKTILPRFAGHGRFREMFLEEARIASRIEHPNVAQILDLGEDRGLLYLVLEYIDGDALSKLNRVCQKRGLKLPTGIALRVLADACAGLHEAHELRDDAGKPLGIVHRDISPHNLLISTKGSVKLIDFGIAKTESSNASLVDAGVLKGKIPYMCPEQALGRPVDRRGDIWAVGAILHHLIAGKVPYEGDSHETTLHLLGSGLPPSPLPPEVHPAIAAVSHRALAHEPSKRFATAAELRDALEQAMVAARAPATSLDVAAFVAEHLGTRARRRRAAIERSVQVLAERARSGDVKREGGEGASAAGTGTAGADAGTTASAGAGTTAVVAAGGGTPAASTQRWSEPPPGTPSYTSIAPATVQTSGSSGGSARRPALVVGAFLAGFGAVVGVTFALFRPPRAPEPGAYAASAPPAAIDVSPRPSASATGRASPIPSVSASGVVTAPAIPSASSSSPGASGGGAGGATTSHSHQKIQ